MLSDVLIIRMSYGTKLWLKKKKKKKTPYNRL